MKRKRGKDGRFLPDETEELSPKFRVGDVVRYHGLKRKVTGIQITFVGSLAYYLLGKRDAVLENELRRID